MRDRGPGVVTVVPAAIVLLLLSVSSPAVADARDRTYIGPVALTIGGERDGYILDRVDVGATSVTVRLRFHNSTSGALSLTCPAEGPAARQEMVLDARRQARTSTSSYCRTHPGRRAVVRPGAELAVTAAFPRGGWTAEPFELMWYGHTGGTLALADGRITVVGATSGVAASARRTPGGWWTWVALGILGCVVLVWARVLLARGRVLVSAASVGVGWLVGVRSWPVLLLIATAAALAMVYVRDSWFGPAGAEPPRPSVDQAVKDAGFRERIQQADRDRAKSDVQWDRWQ